MVVSRELPELRVKQMSWWTEPAIQQLVDRAAGPQRGTHASTHETAFLMAAQPDAVHMERVAPRDAPVSPSRELDNAARFKEMYPDGVMGLDPSRATTELGKQIWDKSVEICALELENW